MGVILALTNAARRTTPVVRKRARALRRPTVRAGASTIFGFGLIVYNLSLWSAVIAGILAGVLFVVYGLVFVDVDENSRRRRG